MENDQPLLPLESPEKAHCSTAVQSELLQCEKIITMSEVEGEGRPTSSIISVCDACKQAHDGRMHLYRRHSICDVCLDRFTAKMCNACNEPINCFSQNHKYFMSKDGTKRWHDFCAQCSICQAVITSELKRFKWNDHTMCATCFDNACGPCANCGQIIFRKSLGQKMHQSKDGKRYHRKCLICKGCNKSLVQVPFYCHDEGGTYCADCYDLKIGATCGRCQKLIRVFSQLEVKCVREDGTTFHGDCLLCDSCHKFTGDSKMFPYEDSLLCAACYDAKTAFLCTNCKKAINANSEGHQEYSSQDGLSHWHSHCLICWQCNFELAGKTIFWRNGRMFCARCVTNSATFRRTAEDIILHAH